MSDRVLCVREFTSEGMNEFKVGDKRMTKRTGDKRGMEWMHSWGSSEGC